MTTQTRILIADDQENIRSGFRLILDAQPDMTVVAEASNGQAAVDWPGTCGRTSCWPTSACRASTAWR